MRVGGGGEQGRGKWWWENGDNCIRTSIKKIIFLKDVVHRPKTICTVCDKPVQKLKMSGKFYSTYTLSGYPSPHSVGSSYAAQYRARILLHQTYEARAPRGSAQGSCTGL